ncbi:MAG: autotransporter-associated beta strand repeat-containing protein, partial [Pirellulales bacterium]
SSATFREGLTSASSRAGGATIDTNGKTITVAQPLLADAGSPGGGLIKTGSGTLTLTGTNTYSGGTTIKGGALSVAGDSRLGATSGRLTLDGGTLETTSSFTLAGSRTVTLGTAGGSFDHAGSSTLTIAGNVTGTASTMTVRSASTVNAAIQFDGTVSLGRLVLTGSTTGAGLRQSARITAPVTIAAGQTLHLNGANGTGTATSTYTDVSVVLQSGTLRNRYGGNTFQGAITLAADSTLENRIGNGNSLTVAADRLALGSSMLTVRSGTAPTEWVALAGGITGGAASGIRLTGGGQLRLAGDNRGFAGSVMIEEGEVRIDSPAAVNASVEFLFSGTAASKSLILATPSSAVGGIVLSGRERIDVGTGSLTVLTGLTPDSVVAALVKGRGDGDWQSQDGITSSAVAADVAAARPRAVGWLEEGGGAIRIAYAAPGDANLDGAVDILDAANIVAEGRFGSGQPANWSQGDFGYDGVLDILDVAEFIGTGLFNTGSYRAMVAVPPVVAVPEPSAIAIVAAVASMIVGIRLRHIGPCPDAASGRCDTPGERQKDPSLRSARYGLALLITITPVLAPADETAWDPPHLEGISGIHPHLVMSNAEGECGIGGVVPWAGRLWVITYGPHLPRGSSDKLSEITPNLRIVSRPESIGGTPAARMIHPESQQLLLGPHLIDAAGKVRTVPYDRMPGRHTGFARHLANPADKVYVATMEEGLYELDVHDLTVRTLIRDGNQPPEGTFSSNALKSKLPGYHGKGCYSGQGRVVYANNGDRAAAAQAVLGDPSTPSGALAEWRRPGEDWSLVRRNQFTEVTGPGGIHGNSRPDRDPIWSIGWDHRSLILMVLDDGVWHAFRLPKVSHAYDGAHGWNTEWPRIRDVGDIDLLMTMHGCFWRFPVTVSSSNPHGIRPRSAYLKVIGDFCRWNDSLVFGCDDAAAADFKNKRGVKGAIAGPVRSNSNLWFTDPSLPDQLGPPHASGAVWLHDDVAAGARAEPLLVAGWETGSIWFVNGGD